PMQSESSVIYELNPVTFAYNQDVTETPQFGLIAEEVDEVFPALVIYDQEGLPFTVRYEVLPVLLLNELQKQKIDIEKYKTDVNDLKVAVEALKKKMNKFFNV